MNIFVTEKFDIEIVQEQIKLKTPISPKVEKRIILLNTERIRTGNSGSYTDQQKPKEYDAPTCGNNRTNKTKP